MLEAEQRIVEAAGRTRRRRARSDEVELSVLAAALDGDRLNRGQRELVRRCDSDQRAVQLALAPAGSGKTTAMQVLAQVWTEAWLQRGRARAVRGGRCRARRGDRDAVRDARQARPRPRHGADSIAG